jgi:hypothetical protein
MTEQTETQRLAAALDALLGYRGINVDVGKAAAELRRLDEVEKAYNLLLEKTYAQPAERKAGCTLCGYCAATGERVVKADTRNGLIDNDFEENT